MIAFLFHLLFPLILISFNNNFNEPLRGHIIESATRVVNYRQYLYKNETLIDFLELDYELCERLGLQSIYKTKTKAEIDKDYYKKKLKLEGKVVNHQVAVKKKQRNGRQG